MLLETIRRCPLPYNLQMRLVLTSRKTVVLKLSEEQFYDRFRTVLEPALLTVLAVEPALLGEMFS